MLSSRRKQLLTHVVTGLSVALSLLVLSGCTPEANRNSQSIGHVGAAWLGEICIENRTGSTISYNYVTGLTDVKPFDNQVAQGDIPQGERACGYGRYLEVQVKLPSLNNVGTLSMTGGDRYATFDGKKTPWLGIGQSYYFENAGYRVDVVAPADSGDLSTLEGTDIKHWTMIVY